MGVRVRVRFIGVDCATSRWPNASAMNCPTCGHTESRVLRTKEDAAAVVRIRECLECGKRWKTSEVPTKIYERAAATIYAYQDLASAVNGVEKRPRRQVPTALYRHYAADGSLLYVGVARREPARRRQHKRTAKWFSLVTRTEIQTLPSRAIALETELLVIRSENPLYNIAGKE